MAKNGLMKILKEEAESMFKRKNKVAREEARPANYGKRATTPCPSRDCIMNEEIMKNFARRNRIKWEVANDAIGCFF